MAMLNTFHGLIKAILLAMAVGMASVNAAPIISEKTGAGVAETNNATGAGRSLPPEGRAPARTKKVMGGTQLDFDANSRANDEAWGRTFFARSEALDITQSISVTQVVRLAKRLPEGSLMKLFSSRSLGTWLQSADANFRNYVSISSGSGFKWRPVTSSANQLVQATLTFQLVGGAIEIGEQFEIKFEDLRIPLGDLDALELPVAFSPEDSKDWHVLDSELRRLKPGSPASLQIHIDGEIEGEGQVSAQIQPVDALGFATLSDITSFDLLKNNKLVDQVNKKNGLYIASNLSLDSTQSNQFTARSPGGGLRGTITHLSLDAEAPSRIIWTDFSDDSLRALGIKEGLQVQNAPDVDRSQSLDAEALLQDLITAADLTLAQLSTAPVTDLIRLGRLGQEPGFEQQGFAATVEDRPAESNLPELKHEQALKRPLVGTSLEAGIDPVKNLPASESTLDGTNSDPTQGSLEKPGITHSQGSKQGGLTSEITFSRDIRTLREGGQTLSLAQGQKVLMIAQPELTSDRRAVRPALIELLSGPGSHPWMIDHFALLGDSFGVAASRRSFNPRTRVKGPETGIVVQRGQTLFEALEQGQTFVTTGQRAHLDFKVNGTTWGRSKDRAVREISAGLTSETPPLWAKLHKNGKALVKLKFSPATTPALNATPDEPTDRAPTFRESGTIYLLLESSARPLKPGITSPRNGREWLGLITLNDMTLKTASAPQMLQVTGTRLLARPQAAQVDFLAWTQGQSALIRIDLERSLLINPEVAIEAQDASDVSAEDGGSETVASLSDQFQSVQLEIAEGFEDLSFISASRPSAATPKFSEVFSIEDLKNQTAERDLWVDGYQDRISMWFDPGGRPGSERLARSSNYTLFYSDVVDPLPGDYYTIEVLLEDGTQVFGSPIFVGGFAQAKLGPAGPVKSLKRVPKKPSDSRYDDPIQ